MPKQRTVSNRTSHDAVNGIVNIGGYRGYQVSTLSSEAGIGKECVEFNYWGDYPMQVCFDSGYHIRKRMFQIAVRTSVKVVLRWRRGGYQTSWRRRPTNVWKEPNHCYNR